ncbi:acetyltransferase [Halorubrum tibetense]|uniref:Acetyltransferase n=1 Tax=Halorubrum tibetense TaxID=175631 RepID=A0ABD5S837_9EURY
MKVIYCAGEQGKVVLDILRASGDSDNVVFVDDDPSLHGRLITDVPVIGGLDAISERSEETIQCLIAFGDQPDVRLDLAEDLSKFDSKFFNAIHPSSSISGKATLGYGVTVNGQSYIGPHCDISNHVIVDSCVNLSHDCALREGATITPSVSLAGGVDIGRNSYIGPNATIVEDVTIGENVIVGAGSVVTEDVPSETTVVGVPASPTETE